MSGLAVFFLATWCLATDINGIWIGQQVGRGGEPQDVAFRFKVDGQTLTGKMFGDEFDLSLTEGSFAGDQIRFVVTTTNYYSGTKTKFLYTGAIKGVEMELVREPVATAENTGSKRPIGKQTIKLSRIKQ